MYTVYKRRMGLNDFCYFEAVKRSSKKKSLWYEDLLVKND